MKEHQGTTGTGRWDIPVRLKRVVLGRNVWKNCPGEQSPRRGRGRARRKPEQRQRDWLAQRHGDRKEHGT